MAAHALVITVWDGCSSSKDMWKHRYVGMAVDRPKDMGISWTWVTKDWLVQLITLGLLEPGTTQGGQSPLAKPVSIRHN